MILVHALTGVGFYLVKSRTECERIAGSHFGMDSLEGILKLNEMMNTNEDWVSEGLKGMNCLDMTVGDIYGHSMDNETLSRELLSSNLGRI